MLKTLTIKNYALIDELHVNFGRGLNILTGETGAGKSIIIGALSLLLGEKAKPNIIRKGAKMAVVEGLFDLPSTLEELQLSKDIPLMEDGLLIRREIHQSGRSRCFLNDSAISNSLLAEIGDWLVDLHGQHEHQTLLKKEKHIEYLDSFGIDQKLLQNTIDSYKNYKSLIEELKELIEKEKILKEKRELLEFQVNEIKRLAPRPGEDEELEKEENILKNFELLFQTSNSIRELLYDGDGAVSEKLSEVEKLISTLTSLDSNFEKWLSESHSARIITEEISKSIEEYVSRIEFDPQRLEEIRDRLGQLTRLKKKYGSTIDEIIKYQKNIEAQLSKIDDMGTKIDEISSCIEEERKRLSDNCMKLSQMRKTIASELEDKIECILEELGLNNGVFKVKIEEREDPDGELEIDGKRYRVSRRGIDRVEFFISLNVGEEPKPLAEVASGGEISRIMLALKTVLAEVDQIPTLIFDEIDSGISGRIAMVVGKNLREVAKKRQVICITHLPQIASNGEFHFCVEKEEDLYASHTRIRPLNREERILEIAKLIGGEKITESAIQSARELLKAGGN